MDERARKLRRIFRYLKRGVFPPESIDEFTVGRTTELTRIGKRLDDVQQGASGHVFVEGNYGRGKSHVLKAIEAVALKKGFAVSWVTLDGYNHACNHPTRYFHSLLANLRVPNSPIRGLASLVRLWLRGQESANVLAWANQSGAWLRHAIVTCHQQIDSVEQTSYLDAWIESEWIARKNGRTWFATVSERMQATASLVRAAGYSGVVYLFDELETVATLLWGVRQRYLSYEFLNILVDGRKHSNCFFAFAATPDFGIKLNNDRGDREHYANEYPEACRFIQRWYESSVDLVQLRQLSSADMATLCRRLRAFHEEGFGWNANERFSEKFVEGFVSQADRLNMGTREVIKSFVNLLEISEQYPEARVTAGLRAGA